MKIEGRRRSDAERHGTNIGTTRQGVSTARRCGRDWLILLVNEDATMQMGVEVSGLDDLNGMTFEQLYGDETVTIHRGELITRMKPHEVKLFATRRTWEARG